MAPKAHKRRRRQSWSDARVIVSKVEISLNEPKNVLSVSFGGRSDLTIKLSTEELTRFIGALAIWRAEMSPQFAAEYMPVARVEAMHPAWYTEPALKPEGSFLHFRHAGLGWLSFWLPPNEAAKLANLLREQGEARNRRPKVEH